MKRTVLLCLIAAILLPTWAAAEVSNQEWSKIRKEFSTLWAQKKKIEAVELLGKADDMRAVNMLFKILVQYGEADDVNEAALEALGKTKDEKAIEWLAKNVTKRMEPSKKVMLCETLAKIKNPKIADALKKMLEKGKDGPSRAAAIDALGLMGEKSAIPAIIEALRTDKAWQVRYAAIEALVRFMDKRAIPALIERARKETGRLKGDCLRALRALTAEDHDTPEAWESWWKLNEGKNLQGGGHESFKKDGEERKEKRRTAGAGDGGSVTSIPTYYGIKIFSKRIVFVIDLSGSMADKFEGKKPKQNQTVVISGTGKDKGASRKAVLPWKRIRTKWDLAREQLIFTLKQLNPKTNFNIIWYNKSVWAWKKNVVPASPGNVAEAVKMLRKLKPKDSTNIYGALKRGFALDGKSQPTEISNYKGGVDTIFFLTDGWPTSGKIYWKRQGRRKVNEDWVADMMKAVSKWNRSRKLKVHTIGIGDHCKELMQRLAEEFGGEYVVPGEED